MIAAHAIYGDGDVVRPRSLRRQDFHARVRLISQSPSTSLKRNYQASALVFNTLRPR